MYLNPIFSFFVFSIAILTAFIISLRFPSLISTNNRNEAIDGLRGFLGVAVFIHHATVWRQFVLTDNWGEVSSNLYNHYGTTSVSLFFMITSFLFVSKIINQKKKNHWPTFFISRLFRLAPLYYFSLIFILTFVMILSDWQIKTSMPNFLFQIFNIATFNMLATFSFNDYEFANYINAGVLWTLRFEWFFYLSLPLIAFFILKTKKMNGYIILSSIFILLFFYSKGLNQNHMMSFAGGAIAPFLIKYTNISTKVLHPIFSILIIICFVLIIQFHLSDSVWCKLLITIAFTIIALGNTVFGLLKISPLKLLSEVCYSTYLLHGIILFVFFYSIVGIEATKKYSDVEFCCIILALTPILIILSYITYTTIEKPFMDLSRKINSYLIK